MDLRAQMMLPLRVLFLALVALPLLARPVLAHEKWFVDAAGFPLQLDQAAWNRALLALALAGGALAMALLIEALWRRLHPGTPVTPPRAKVLENQRRLFAWIPLILAVHIAVSLIVSGVQRQLFAPNLMLPRTFFGGITALLEIAVALSFFYGALTRVAAAVLMLLFPVSLLAFGIVDTFEHLELLGIAAFLLIFGRGPFSLDAIFGTPPRPPRAWLPRAVPLLRVLTGLTIAWLGFSEKLWNIPLGVAFLERHPFNFMPALGFVGFSNADFVVAAGLVEVVTGIVIASGLVTRPVIALAWVPYNLTLPFLGWVELVGHLPTYGIIGVLLLWGSGRDVRPYLREVDDTIRGA